MYLFNSILNPLVYAIRMQQCRRAAKKLICKKKIRINSYRTCWKSCYVAVCPSPRTLCQVSHFWASYSLENFCLLFSFSSSEINFVHLSPHNPITVSWFPHVRFSGFRHGGNLWLWNPESGKVLHVESGVLGFGIRNPAWIIRDLANDWNPESKFHWQGIWTSIAWNPEATATTLCNPELSLTGLDYLAWGRSWPKILVKRFWDTSPFSRVFLWNLQLTCDTHS